MGNSAKQMNKFLKTSEESSHYFPQKGAMLFSSLGEPDSLMRQNQGKMMESLKILTQSKSSAELSNSPYENLRKQLINISSTNVNNEDKNPEPKIAADNKDS
mmetsp:Transcript_13168/g.20483  ORF Transcript_13168/g.20483 Transcript_13168/m.20483 type:complete len:102 (-) Transcript_13168:3284-3589(-)